MKKKFIDITGQRFSKWLVIERVANSPLGQSRFLCRCDCGVVKTVSGREMRSGKSKSCGCIKKKPKGYSVKTVLWIHYTRSAKKRDYEWSLNKEKFYNLISQNCFYCGAVPSLLPKSYQGNREEFFKSNGIDRRDNKVGYTLNNVVTCCKKCNFAKHKMSEQEFKDWVKQAYEHLYIKPLDNPQSPEYNLYVDGCLCAGVGCNSCVPRT